MLARCRVEDNEVAFPRPDADVHFAIRPDREASRIHFTRVHPSEVFHCSSVWIEADELGIWIRAGVEPGVLADVELPKVILGA